MKRIIVLFVIFILNIFIVTGCSNKNLYDAKIITSNYEFNEDFLINNKTFGADSNDGHYIDDDTFPKERMIIVDNETSFNNTFKTFEDIDFNKKMIVMHAFTTASNSEYELKNIELNGKKLTIEYKTKNTNRINPPNASKPDTKWVIVKLDLLDINEVNFVFLA